MIEVRSASLVYQDFDRQVYACREVTLEVAAGEFVAILGPSGSGKSSLLYLLSGLKSPTSGSAWFKGRDYAEMSDAERARIRIENFGFLFQQAFLVGYLTAIENVMLVDPIRGDSRERALDLLDRVGLRTEANRYPSELSGGQKQRVCVARALYNDPEVVFADEPTASLDQEAGKGVVQVLREHRTGSLVMVTHDQAMIASADRVVTMDDGAVYPAPVESSQ
ncbi:MAG: ABC transporter ATP-binding protein [Armatimonadetes bacterium]|nr:MAG: ABC transporter ATP-binding protein [Armatimonadota bacterium]MCE7899243.1 ABC transporter ATP-binding protein [Armatimonadetes bacterium ATM1]MDL1927816.1 ABC transporter ATP-binding protein [Fimbriimonadia bacterium ATM]MBC6969419.1 ABC transporter ATP-binding protein [Armatimonadota bacterium]MBL1150661.1 ABC transporter ATP-binding protein [Armatimonadota bacterium]